MVTEDFEKGGHRLLHNEYIVAIYPEQVITQLVLTPDSDGLVANVMSETWSADGTPPVLRCILDDSEVVGPVDGACPEPGVYLPTVDEGGWDLARWLEAVVQATLNAEAKGYTHAGRFLLNGQPSIRYESRSRVSLRVIEFVEANPLFRRDSYYSILNDGMLMLESQRTVMSVSAGEPTAVPGVGTGEGG